MCKTDVRFIYMQVWPPEAFEEAAELMEALAKTFERAHGQKLKPAFAESLTQMLHPIGKVRRHVNLANLSPIWNTDSAS